MGDATALVGRLDLAGLDELVDRLDAGVDSVEHPTTRVSAVVSAVPGARLFRCTLTCTARYPDRRGWTHRAGTVTCAYTELRTNGRAVHHTRDARAALTSASDAFCGVDTKLFISSKILHPAKVFLERKRGVPLRQSFWVLHVRPVGKLGGGLASLKAVELGGIAIEAALERAGVEGEQVDHVVMGNVLQAGRSDPVAPGSDQRRYPEEQRDDQQGLRLGPIGMLDSAIRRRRHGVVGGGSASMSNARTCCRTHASATEWATAR